MRAVRVTVYSVPVRCMCNGWLVRSRRVHGKLGGQTVSDSLVSPWRVAWSTSPSSSLPREALVRACASPSQGACRHVCCARALPCVSRSGGRSAGKRQPEKNSRAFYQWRAFFLSQIKFTRDNVQPTIPLSRRRRARVTLPSQQARNKIQYDRWIHCWRRAGLLCRRACLVWCGSANTI